MKRIPARLTALAAVALVLLSLVLPSWGTPAVAAVAAPGRLSGVVRDETGAALAGADVRLSTPSGPLAGVATTDAGGNYTISVGDSDRNLPLTAWAGQPGIDCRITASRASRQCAAYVSDVNRQVSSPATSSLKCSISALPTALGTC